MPCKKSIYSDAFLFRTTYILRKSDEIQAYEEREWYQLNTNFRVPYFFIDEFKKHGVQQTTQWTQCEKKEWVHFFCQIILI